MARRVVMSVERPGRPKGCLKVLLPLSDQMIGAMELDGVLSSAFCLIEDRGYRKEKATAVDAGVRNGQRQ